ncbi:MAG: glycoside hydrolase family 26 protein [Candidatus Saccharimonadales bacterium]
MSAIRSNQTGFSVLEIVIVVIAIVLIGGISYLVYASRQTSTENTNTTHSPFSSSVASLIPPPIPKTGAYLGAYVNPEHISSSNEAVNGTQTIQQLPTFNRLIGKSLAILQIYTGFNKPLPISVLNGIEYNHSIPLISWGCTSVNSISSGQYDSYITGYAQSLKNFSKPVFLRWYWEMNQMNKTGSQPAGGDCGGYNNGPAFVTAWQHIYNIFQKVGATNVAFVWCPGYSGGNFNTYYPGDAYVDWIGVDRYERDNNHQPFLNFGQMFGSYVQEWASHNKPIIIAESAEMGPNQAQYLDDVRTQMPNYPQVKAFVYFDATGPAGDWQLSGSGIAAFQLLANSSYFEQ